MATKEKKVGITRKKGRLYFIDKQGDISSVPAKRSAAKKKKKPAAKKKAAPKRKPAKKSAAKKRKR